jgi:DNA-binding HxlR family transcriptional regulator
MPTVSVLMFLLDRGEVRYAELARLISSRGTLSLSLKELDEEKLIVRRVVALKPIQAYYSLTKKGRLVASELRKTEELLRA